MTTSKRGREYKKRLRMSMKQRNRRIIEEILTSSQCADCGISDRRVLDFDHVPERGEKLFEIGGRRANIETITQLRAEIAKCDVVCANCHRIRTWMRKHREASL